MRIKFIRSYPKLENGVKKLDRNNKPIIVFVYEVTGSDEELEQYHKIQEDNKVKTHKDGDKSLWFTTHPVGLTGTLMISTNGKIYADTSNIDMVNSLVKNFGEAGRMMAKDMLGNIPVGAVVNRIDEPLDLDK